MKRAAYRAHSLQVVLATKDANVKTRTAACDLLVAVAGVVLRNTDPSGGEECSGLSSLLTKLFTGVAGTTPHMAGASPGLNAAEYQPWTAVRSIFTIVKSTPPSANSRHRRVE